MVWGLNDQADAEISGACGIFCSVWVWMAQYGSVWLHCESQQSCVWEHRTYRRHLGHRGKRVENRHLSHSAGTAHAAPWVFACFPVNWFLKSWWTAWSAMVSRWTLSLYTVSLIEQCHSTLWLSLVTLHGHATLSLYAVNSDCHFTLSLYTVIQHCHSTLSLCTITLHCYSTPSVYTAIPHCHSTVSLSTFTLLPLHSVTLHCPSTPSPCAVILLGGGEFRGGNSPRGKFRISTWCGISPSFFEGKCRTFLMRNCACVSHRRTRLGFFLGMITLNKGANVCWCLISSKAQACGYALQILWH